MDDRSKLQMLLAVTVFVIVGALAFLALVAIQEPLNGEFGILMLIVAAVVVLLPILFLVRMRRDLKEGFPLIDERGVAIKQKTGYYSFMAAIYIILVFLYYDFIFVQVFEVPSLTPTEYFLLLDLILVGVYVGFWWWFTKKGDISDRG